MRNAWAARARPAPLLTLFLLLTLLAPAGAGLAAQSEPPEEGQQGGRRDRQRLTTQYFTIYYPTGEEKTAQWYASFADEVNRNVSYLLGAQPVEGLALRIYATEPDYMRANPMAEMHPGIMAHAVPERKEIGVAVERLRQQPPQLARESFRHEMTHIVAASLTEQTLPIGFHEGLAQYNELSESRGQEVRNLITDAQAKGIPLLTWTDLNDYRLFRRNIAVAYPQSYTVMAFLADRYGMEPFAKFIQSMAGGRDYSLSIFTAYGKRLDDLEREWRDEYLPYFLEEGWQRNVLSAHDLSHGLALWEAGRFKDAEAHFDSAKTLYHSLNHPTRAQEASDYLQKAKQAVQADEATTSARKSLEVHDYTASRKSATEAASTFTDLNLPDHATRARDISLLAQKGLDGIALLEKARSDLSTLNLPASHEGATRAGEAFSQLGDAERVAQANDLLQELHGMQQMAGYGVLGAGGLALLGGLALFARRRTRKTKQREASRVQALREENPSWL